MAKGKRYDKEFRLGAARLVVEQGYTQAEAGRRLGVTPTTIKTWIERFRKSGELPLAGQPVPEAEELKTLRKELRRVQMENEILKKAAAYFAKESL
jgi:transposase-like protein